MNNDWWSKKLSNSSQPPQPTSTPPITPPMRNAIRIPQQAAVPTSPTVRVEPQRNVLDPSRSENEQINMGDAIRLWKGGEAARRETAPCPECGSHLLFSRSKSMVNGAAPAPRCYECGWNGRYAQGDQSNWV